MVPFSFLTTPVLSGGEKHLTVSEHALVPLSTPEDIPFFVESAHPVLRTVRVSVQTRLPLDQRVPEVPSHLGVVDDRPLEVCAVGFDKQNEPLDFPLFELTLEVSAVLESLGERCLPSSPRCPFSRFYRSLCTHHAPFRSPRLLTEFPRTVRRKGKPHIWTRYRSEKNPTFCCDDLGLVRCQRTKCQFRSFWVIYLVFSDFSVQIGVLLHFGSHIHR